MKIKVFLLIDVMHALGGAERQILELAKNIDKSKYQLIVGCLSSKDSLLREIEVLGVKIISFKVKRIYDLFGINQGLKFVKFLKQEKIDILITYHFGSDIWGTIFGRLARVPVIISNRRDMGFWKKWYHNLAYKLINRFMNKVIVVSEAVKQAVMKLEGLNSDKIVVIKNGVDLSYFATSGNKHTIRSSLGIDENSFVIGCVGNIKNVKGQEYLIKALAEVRKAFTNLKCIFIGAGHVKEATTIMNYVHTYGVNDLCLFLGKRNDISNLLSIMDICVLPSLSEGLSNTLLEYMAEGKPVVATAVGGNVEVIRDKINGLLVQKANAEALAEKIIYLLKNKEERERLGLQAKEDVRNGFTIEKMAQKYENLFAELIKMRKSASFTKSRPATPAIILGMTANGLSIARSLGRKGITVIGIDSDKKQLGMFSRYCKKIIYPNVIQQEKDFIEFLIRLGQKLSNKAILYVTSDEYIAAVSKNREELSYYFKFSLPDAWIIETFLNKSKSYPFAQQHGLHCPQTYFVNNYTELEKIAGNIKFPCILKPLFSHLWRIKFAAKKVIRVESTKDLIDTHSQLNEEGLSVMIQEIIPGKDDQFYIYEGYFNNNHQPLGIFTKRKVRQYPIHYGIGSFHRSERNEEVMNIGTQFLSKIGYCGFVGIEFKRDNRDGKLKFMEINLRTLMSGELPVASGVNLPYIYYKDLCGEKVQKVDSFREGVKLVDLELDIASFFKYKKLKEITFLQWIKSFRGKIVEAYFAWDDLLPSMLVSLRFIGTLTRKTKQLFSRPTEAIPPYPEKDKNTTILHLISSNGLFGAEKILLNIAEANNVNGHRSWVVGLRNSRNPHEEVIEKAKKRNIPAQAIESRGKFDFGAVNQLTRFIQENNIGILHTHNYKANFIGLLAAKRVGIPIIATLHGYIGNGRKLRFYETLDRLILRFFNKVILVDDSLKKWFKNGTVKYEVINNGITTEETQGQSGAKRSLPGGDKDTRTQVKTRLGIDKNDLVIGTVGRLSEEKGHRFLIEAFARLIKDYPNARLLIVGDGELRKNLERLSETLGIIDKVTFTGFQEDVTQYYSIMDIYVSSSLVEHFPMSILEAMSFGKAIVATDVGGTAKLISHMRTGILIKPHSTEEIYTALLELVRGELLRVNLAEGAYNLVKQNYSIKNTLTSYEKMYGEILK